jgi:hypothetical protein
VKVDLPWGEKGGFPGRRSRRGIRRGYDFSWRMLEAGISFRMPADGVNLRIWDRRMAVPGPDEAAGIRDLAASV